MPELLPVSVGVWKPWKLARLGDHFTNGIRPVWMIDPVGDNSGDSKLAFQWLTASFIVHGLSQTVNLILDLRQVQVHDNAEHD